MTTRTKVLIGILIVVVAFAAGRYSARAASSHTTTDSKTNTESDTAKDTHKDTTTTVTKGKDGTETVVTHVIEDTTSNKKTTSENQSKVDQTITASKSIINISALVGLDSTKSFTPMYGVSANKEFIGPITIGAFGYTNGIIGISIGVNF